MADKIKIVRSGISHEILLIALCNGLLRYTISAKKKTIVRGFTRSNNPAQNATKQSKLCVIKRILMNNVH